MKAVHLAMVQLSASLRDRNEKSAELLSNTTIIRHRKEEQCVLYKVPFRNASEFSKSENVHGAR